VLAMTWSEVNRLPWATAEKRTIVVVSGSVPRLRTHHREVGKVLPAESAGMALHLLRKLLDQAGGFNALLVRIEAGDELARAAADLSGIAPAIIQEAAEIDPATFASGAEMAGRIAVAISFSEALRNHHRRHAFSVQALKWARRSTELAIAAGAAPIYTHEQIEALAERAAETYLDTLRGRIGRIGHEAGVAAFRGEHNLAVHLRTEASRAMAEAGMNAGLERRRLRASAPALNMR
jgi:uncharacterized protein YgbK (DUF1537 family)